MFKRLIRQIKLLYKFWYVINYTYKGMCNNWDIFDEMEDIVYEIEEHFKECTFNTEEYKAYQEEQRKWEYKFYNDFVQGYYDRKENEI